MHFHKEGGIIHACYHKAQGLLTSWQFWVGTFFSFPIEHWLWEKTPLNIITHWLGL